VARAVAGGGKLLLCGNGGSAADCQHVSAEFVSRLTVDFERPGIPAIALTTDTSFLTAFANDVDFQGVFARQVDTLGQPGDVLFGITTSGRSKNVLQAISHARRRGMRVIALVGAQGLATDEADVVIRVPSLETQHIQESHLAIEHVFCHLVERHVYGRSETAAVGPGQNAQKGESPR
jgi:D-sedoheptulose 7-phosphate isomerase